MATPASCSTRGRREPQHLAGRQAGRVVEEFAEFWQADLDEAHQALAHPRLLLDEGHREAGRLAHLHAR